MRRLLLRLARRRSSWESRNVDQIINLEFRPQGETGPVDLRPSVYVLHCHEPDPRPVVVQIHAEHAASFLSAPPTGAVDVDAEGCYAGELRWSRGMQRFAASFSTHRELVLADEQALRDLVAAVIARMPANEYSLSRDDLLKYAGDRLSSGDSEWTTACEAGRAAEWPPLIARMKARLAKEATTSRGARSE
jgi:hypothetical protein